MSVACKFQNPRTNPSCRKDWERKSSKLKEILIELCSFSDDQCTFVLPSPSMFISAHPTDCQAGCLVLPVLYLNYSQPFNYTQLSLTQPLPRTGWHLLPSHSCQCPCQQEFSRLPYTQNNMSDALHNDTNGLDQQVSVLADSPARCNMVGLWHYVFSRQSWQM